MSKIILTWDQVIFICTDVSAFTVLLDFKERNTIVATKWGELSEEERKQWAARAEAVCSTSIQVNSYCHAACHVT